MYQVLARKYRPQTFAELLGQEHVRATIENAIAQGRIAHGYIFAGQRGTGKTTVARILARCLNCVAGPAPAPCGQCSSCIEIAQGNAPDVIEIDAASNRGINEMRELRENVRYRPSRDRYKIFIIDEAHQITNEAFNALLKTLEEPPEWAVFILCTTEAHKIPATISSRCQQFSFRSVDFALLVERLRQICRAEGIEADEEALAVLAQAGEGSVRDSLSALDQAIACCGSRLEGPGGAAAARALRAGNARADDRSARGRLRGEDARNCGGAGEIGQESAAFLPGAVPLFPQSAGGENRRFGHAADCRRSGRTGEAAGDGGALRRGRPDAMAPAVAGHLLAAAILAATEAAP